MNDVGVSLPRCDSVPVMLSGLLFPTFVPGLAPDLLRSAGLKSIGLCLLYWRVFKTLLSSCWIFRSGSLRMGSLGSKGPVMLLYFDAGAVGSRIFRCWPLILTPLKMYPSHLTDMDCLD